jgi:hypothetical protein
VSHIGCALCSAQRQATNGWPAYLEKAREREVFAMTKRILLVVVFFAALSCGSGAAQNLCPAGVVSDKLICVIPQAFGVNEALSVGSSNSSQFKTSALDHSLSSLNSAAARAAALLPLAPPASGITFTWDSEAKVFSPSTESLGPILGERAETIGKYRVFVEFSYQHIQFDHLDGISLKQLPVTLTQPDDSTDVSSRTCSVTGDNATQCGFIRDVIKTNTRIDLKIHQFTTFITFGLTNRIDISASIPIENLRMGAVSTATIVDNARSGIFSFPIVPGTCGGVKGGVIVPCLVNSFSNTRNASGIGDITLRVKGTAWKGERAALALGVDIRTATGDSLNFLGAGAAGVGPFVVWSYQSRISPHASVGYQTNGSSLIAGDITSGTKARLPGEFRYATGADVRVTKWLTAAFDIVGQQVFEAARTSKSTVSEPGACLDTTGNCNAALGFAPPQIDPSLSQLTGTFNSTGASVGVKARPFGSSLVVTTNALFGLTNGGLHSQVVPFLAVSYTF